MAPTPRVVVGGHTEVVDVSTKAFLVERWTSTMGMCKGELQMGDAPAPVQDYAALCQAVRTELVKRTCNGM